MTRTPRSPIAALLEHVDATRVLSVAPPGDPLHAVISAWCTRSETGLVAVEVGQPSTMDPSAWDLDVDVACLARTGDSIAGNVLRELRDPGRRAGRSMPLVVLEGVLPVTEDPSEAIGRHLGQPAHGLRTLSLPAGEGLVLVADPDVARKLATLWEQLALSPLARDVLASTAPSPARPTQNAPAPEDDLEVARRVIQRQDEELARLRGMVRREDALERRVRALETDLARLRSRRSVRTVLRLAEHARPLFELWRGEKRLGQTVPRPRPDRRHRRLRTTHEFASTDTGRFYDMARALVASAPPEFVDRWSRSEQALREQADPARAEADMPLVSVVMPTYNRAALIREAIDTVTDQSYVNWELWVCDDGSDDETEQVVTGIDDDRIHYVRLPHGGAAAARNAGLARAQGELFAYLDTDNLWHPRFLEQLVDALVANPGRFAAYARYVDAVVADGDAEVRHARQLEFDYERLAERNFIDLNGFVHRRSLYDRHGGFDEGLVRQQDWDLVLKYSFLRDPLYVDRFLVIYRRNAAWGQITTEHADNRDTRPRIEAAVASYYRNGLPERSTDQPRPRLTVLSWDICRNHFSKAYNLAEAVAADDPARVQLMGFRFFDEAIFPPYATARPMFATRYVDGTSFPALDDALARAVAAVRGDVVYAVKPRLPSLGVGLLANYHFGRPLVLELNDLESVVTTPRAGQRPAALELADVDPADPGLLDPYGELWTQIMEGLASRVPLRATHNHVLDDHMGGGAFYVRNLKDDVWFDPDRYDRDAVRAELGLRPEERVLLFGGMVRRHKGVFHFAEVLERLGPEWRLLVVGSRETPDQKRLRERVGDRVRIIDPVDRNEMARINLAADAVVLWLDPDVAASHFQMPFKLTDALAMRVPVLANPIGELAGLGERGYLRLVPFGDDAALQAALRDVTADASATRSMVDAGRRLYLRQFSYRAVRQTMDLVMDEALQHPGPLPVAAEFAEFFARFRALRAGRPRAGARP